MRKVTDTDGFTLIELVFVLAIILVLTALIIPVATPKLMDAQVARVNHDVQTIAIGLVSFMVDLGHFPACDNTDCNPLARDNQTLRFLALGDGVGDLRESFPADDPNLVVKWNLRDPVNNSIIPARNNGFNHLGRNDPNADAVSGSETARAQDYEENEESSKRWKGPYIANVSLDPWGHAYIVHVGAMEENGIPVLTTPFELFEKPEGWILSAGPDGMFQTSPRGTILLGDDIGFILSTSTSAKRFARSPHRPVVFPEGRTSNSTSTRHFTLR